MDTKLRRWARRIAGANAEYDRDHVQQNALRAGSTPIAVPTVTPRTDQSRL